MLQRCGNAIGKQRRGEIIEHRTYHLRCAGRRTLEYGDARKDCSDLIKPTLFAEWPAVAVTGSSAIGSTPLERPPVFRGSAIESSRTGGRRL
jgi:hypothetical protein